jgi:RNA-binding protein 5/10
VESADNKKSQSDTSSKQVEQTTEQLAAEEKAKKEKALQAKKIAKDMERWAKVQNTQKESSSSIGGFKKPLAPPVSSLAAKNKESAAADVGFTVLAKTKSDKLVIDLLRNRDEKRLPSKLKPAEDNNKSKDTAGPLGLVASYGSDSESDDEVVEPPPAHVKEWNAAQVEEKMTDWTKLTCLLCKRLFNTREMLVKHQQLSTLHKTNLEELRAKSCSEGW